MTFTIQLKETGKQKMLIYCGSTNQAFKLSYPSVREMGGLCVHWAHVMSIISYNQGLEKN